MNAGPTFRDEQSICHSTAAYDSTDLYMPQTQLAQSLFSGRRQLSGEARQTFFYSYAHPNESKSSCKYHLINFDQAKNPQNHGI